MSQQIGRIYTYLTNAYKQDFNADPAGDGEVCRRLKDVAMQAVAEYNGHFIDEGAIEPI